MLNALERKATKRYEELEVNEISYTKWEAVDKCNRFGVEAKIVIEMRDDQPEVEHPEFTTVYDHRDKDLFFASKASDDFKSRCQSLGLKFK